MNQVQLKKDEYFKVARADGWDKHTGKTINYRENVGRIVKVPLQVNKGHSLCSETVIHATKDPLNWIGYTGLPCSIFVVKGKPVVKDEKKAGFTAFKIVKEIPEEKFDSLLGFKYSEVIQPLDPRKINPPVIDDKIQVLANNWASVRDSVWDSVRASVRASVWASVWDSIWDLVWDSVRNSIRDSVWDSVRASVWDSVWDSVRNSIRASVWASVWDSIWDSITASVWDSEYACIGALFTQVKKWKYVEHDPGVYPFQPAVELLKLGLVPAIDGKQIYLCHPKTGEKADILWQGPLEVARSAV